MMKLSDYVLKRLKGWGGRHIFLVTGGGAMHLNDSVGTSGIAYVCTHHEQAAAMAAEGYARITNTPGLLNVTTGPGSINALNGVFGAWTDSIPMLILSGQVKREDVYKRQHHNIRQCLRRLQLQPQLLLQRREETRRRIRIVRRRGNSDPHMQKL